MTARRLLLALLLTLVPARALAQLDDLLAPLTPDNKEESKKKANAKKKANPRVKESRKEEPEDDLIAPLVLAKAHLIVKLGVPADGTTVTVDGREVRAGTKIEVDAGDHRVVVKRPGYAEFSKKVKVLAGETVEIPAVMDATAGVLTVTADVPGSFVVIDGKNVGAAPVKGVLLSPGMHEVIVRREGFEDLVSRISVRAGKVYTISGALRPSEETTTVMASNADRPEQTNLVPDAATPDGTAVPIGGTEQRVQSEDWYQRWYVWAGVGAVVVAAATSAVVVSSNHNKGLTPSEVCDLDPKDGKPGHCDDVINGPAAILKRGLNLSVGVRF